MAARVLQCRLRSLASFLKTQNPSSHLRPISTSLPLSQESEVAVPDSDSSLTTTTTPLPPNPSTGSPFYHENWRKPVPQQGSVSLVNAGGHQTPYSLASGRVFAFSQTLNVEGLMDEFSKWTTTRNWSQMKQLFEFWIRSLDESGKPNKPTVSLYNQYLTANVMLGSSAGELLDLLAQMDEYGISPNTASYNIVLKTMCEAKEAEAAEKLIDRMLRTGDQSPPDEESYRMVIVLLFSENHKDSALKYMDLFLKSGYEVSLKVFMDCAWICVSSGRLDDLVSIIEKCQGTQKNKALCPSWNLSRYILEIALQEDHSKLAIFCLAFLARWISRGEAVKPPRFLSVDEGLSMAALSVAGRTYNSSLLDASWSTLKHSLRKKNEPSPESYLGRIHALACLGNIMKAFATLKEFESIHGGSPEAEELFSPFTSLHPLVVACCRNGFSTLDTVYFQLENLINAKPPYKSVAALNCVILGSANIWDLERAYETFESIGKTFGLSPDIHSYNSLMSAFGKHRKTHEASRVFEHLTSLDVKPNAMTYSLLIDAHLVSRDHKSALNVIDDMLNAGLVPSKETLRKVRRRCLRELDFDGNDKVDSVARKLNYRMGGDGRREQLFSLDYATAYV